MSLTLMVTLLVAAVVAADKTPVLIWSSDIPLSDLPQSHIGQTVKTEQFGSSYLKPLISEHNLVVFLQDKLTLEDFINHADVYNINGDGGAFKNVKASLDDQYSVQLPAVSDPSKAISSLIESFVGKVTRVDNPEDVGSLALDEGKQHLILIKLPNILGNDEANAFKRNDEMIGKCLQHLQKRSVKFSAVYTAEASSNVEKKESHLQRRLLASADKNATGKFFNTSQTMMYVQTINVTVVKLSKDANKPDKPMTFSYTFKDLDVTGKNLTNQTKLEELTLKLSNDHADVTMVMDIASTVHGEYQSFNGNVSVSDTNDTSWNVNKMPIDFKIQAIKGFSYHCSKLRASPVLKGYNNTNNQKVYIILSGFQFEAFPANMTTERFSDNVWDCVEFFTSGIWMGILTTLLLIMILFFGVNMIASITTMDRFDDPKGKAMTVTVNE